MNSGKYAFTWPVRLISRSSACWMQLPDRVAVRADDHAALDRRVVGELGAPDDVEVPLREVLRTRGDFGDERRRFGFLDIRALLRTGMIRERGSCGREIEASIAMELPVSSSRWEILPEVSAAALLAAQRRSRDESRDREQIEVPPAVGVRRRSIVAPCALARTPPRARRRPRLQSRARVRNRPTARHIRSRTAAVSERAASEQEDCGLGGSSSARRLQPSVFNAGRLRRLLHRLGGARAEHQPFEQRVARQAVGAVDTRAGSLARGEQARQGRAAPFVGVDAAHEVVRGRTDWNRIRREIEPDLPAHRGDGRKPLPARDAASRCASVRNTWPPVCSDFAHDARATTSRGARSPSG